MNGFVIDALAVYRITRLVTRDTITEELRETIAQEIQTTVQAGLITQKTADKLTYLMECDWCMSIWVATIACFFKKYIPHVWDTIKYIMAASAVAGALSNQE
jgi:hypothetical protein